MPQDPLLVDQIQIEPGSVGTRLIRRAADGSLEFVDAVVTGGITLSQIAGLRSIGGIKVVGQSGAGAEHTTIQSALDAIPVSAGPTEPYTVLIGPGVYAETLNIVRDSVSLIGLGGVSIQPAETTPNGPGAYHTVVVHADLGTIPKHVVIQNVEITNNHNTYACVRVSGGAGSEVGEVGIRLVDCKLQANAAGGNRPIWASSVNHVSVQGGSFAGSSGLAQVVAEECASFAMAGVLEAPALQLDYDSTGSLPSVAGSSYTVSGCPRQGLTSSLSPPLRSTLLNVGDLLVSGCGQIDNVRVSGNRTVTVVGTETGTLTLDDTTSAKFVGGAHGTVTAAGGASLEESAQQGFVAFGASTSEVVVLPVDQPDVGYQVMFELLSGPASQDTPWVTGKTAGGFTVNFSSPQTMTVNWTMLR